MLSKGEGFTFRLDEKGLVSFPVEAALPDVKQSMVLEDFLKPTKFCDSDSKAIHDKARELIGKAGERVGGEPSQTETAREIFDFVRGGIKYRFDVWNRKASDTLEKGYGMCANKANLQAALCRADGIPAGYGCVEIRRAIFRSITSEQEYNRIREVTNHWFGINYLDGHWVPADATLSDDIHKLMHADSSESIGWDGVKPMILPTPYIVSDGVELYSNMDSILDRSGKFGLDLRRINRHIERILRRVDRHGLDEGLRRPQRDYDRMVSAGEISLHELSGAMEYFVEGAPITGVAAVAVIVNDEGEVALVKRKGKERMATYPGAWVFPGGRIEADEKGNIIEPPKEAAFREVLEESGYVVGGLEFLTRKTAEYYDLSRVDYRTESQGIHRVTDTWFFLASPRGMALSEIQKPAEVEGGVLWIKPEEALRRTELSETEDDYLNIPPKTKEVLGMLTPERVKEYLEKTGGK